MRKYWRRHFIVLIVSVILAFWVGMKLGELKGFVMASLGYMPMHHERWSEPQPVNPTGAMPIQGAVYQPSTTPTGR